MEEEEATRGTGGIAAEARGEVTIEAATGGTAALDAAWETRIGVCGGRGEGRAEAEEDDTRGTGGSTGEGEAAAEASVSLAIEGAAGGTAALNTAGEVRRRVLGRRGEGGAAVE